MNKQLEELLHQEFERWRAAHFAAESQFEKGFITLEEMMSKQVDNIKQCSSNFFSAIHQNSDW